MRKTLNLFILLIFIIPALADSLPKSKGRTYAPEEGTFDRRKRIVIQPKCRLISERKVPDDVKNKEIYLGSPGNTCQREITCPKK